MLALVLTAVAAIAWILAYRWMVGRKGGNSKFAVVLDTVVLSTLAIPLWGVAMILAWLDSALNTALTIERAVLKVWCKQVLMIKSRPPKQG